jgi:hypothetical protein
MYIVRDGEALRDGVEISPDDIFAHTKVYRRICSTAAVNCGGLHREMGPNGDATTTRSCISIFPRSFPPLTNNAQLAAKEVSGVYGRGLAFPLLRHRSSGARRRRHGGSGHGHAPAIAAELEKRTGKKWT